MLSDRFYRGPVGRGFMQGNPDLKPETSLQFDVSARYVAGPIQFAAAGYRYRITDLVERYAATTTLFLVQESRACGAAGRGSRSAGHAAEGLHARVNGGNVTRAQ